MAANQNDIERWLARARTARDLPAVAPDATLRTVLIIIAEVL